MSSTGKVEHKNFSHSGNEVRTFGHGKVELMNIGNGTIGRLVLQKGWKWSNDVKPIAKTDWCEAPHFQYLVSGKLHVKMGDGNEFDLQPGDVSYLPAGHDAWVVGDEPVVLVDWYGASNYAKKSSAEDTTVGQSHAEIHRCSQEYEGSQTQGCSGGARKGYSRCRENTASSSRNIGSMRKREPYSAYPTPRTEKPFRRRTKRRMVYYLRKPSRLRKEVKLPIEKT